MIVIAGPCQIESRFHCLAMSHILHAVMEPYKCEGIDFYFKASFDKANRTSVSSDRGVGIEKGLEILAEVKKETGLKVTTDVHDVHQLGQVAEVVDLLQIPAFLSRQTDLLTAAGATGLAVNVKKGQFLAPGDMKHVVEKIQSTRPESHRQKPIYITDRGTCFGYNNLIVDYTGHPEMREHAPVILDATHSIQKPNQLGGKSGGNRELAPGLARAAIANGIDGIFCEVHDDPDNALSDGPNSLTIEMFEELMMDIVRIRRALR